MARFVPGPGSIYRGVNKLPPGTILTLRKGAPPDCRAFWRLEEIVQAGQMARFDASEDEAITQLDRLLRDAVNRRMIADVPLGAFLSGGIDSSTVVALMQANSSRPVRTFSIGLHEEDFNEAHHAARVARHLNTDHTELFVSPRDALDVIPQLPDMFDEPLGNVAQIPMHLLSQMTRRHVKVALTGDGGDELFAGYDRYLQGSDLLRRIGGLPASAHAALKAMIHAMPAAAWTGLSRALPSRIRPPHFGDKLCMLRRVLTGNAGDIYRLIVS